jgi:signal transduction histidine kinase
VEQILFNLVDNACKHAASDSGAPLELCVGRDGKTVRLALRDRGAGVPPEARRRLFLPFSRPAEEAAGGPPGVGLGLALSRRMARQMGGNLRWEPVEGAGSCFVLTLPAEGPY